MGDKGWVNNVIGIAVLGGAITGIVALVVALIATLDGEWVATGVCLVAAALSFGLLAGALLKECPKRWIYQVGIAIDSEA